MKKINKQGKIYYYYYKKKKYKRKPGPRKKCKNPTKRNFQYKVVHTINNKHKHYVGVYQTEEDLALVRQTLEERNAKVLMPKMYINNERKQKGVFQPFKSEYLFLQRMRRDESNNTSYIKNDFGKYVEHTSNSKMWRIFDKMPCHIEETFWVYGYHPIDQRKDMPWIKEHCIDNYLNNPEDIIFITCYCNKLIIKYESDFTFVICKCINDCIRMYNKLEELYADDGRLVFIGYVSGKSPRVRDIIDRIKEKTGWRHTKIIKSNTLK